MKILHLTDEQAKMLDTILQTVNDIKRCQSIEEWIGYEDQEDMEDVFCQLHDVVKYQVGSGS